MEQKNGTVNRWTMIVAGALLLLAGGGSGSALSLLSDRAANNDCRDMVLRLELSDDQVKALSPARLDDKNLATKIETALLNEKIETLRDQVSELRARRTGRGQAPD